MKFLVYFSPYYSNAPDLLVEMKRVLYEYDVDGLYFDGWLGVRDDFRAGYHLMRRARALLGERILYLHSSSEPFGTCSVYLPFVYAYADYVLSGEAGRSGLEMDEFGWWTEAEGNLAPLETGRTGVFLAGAGIGPKDIPETVSQGSGAAGKALSLLSRWRGVETSEE